MKRIDPTFTGPERIAWFNAQSRARYAVRKAIERGTLPHYGVKCAYCGAPATEYDHRDYFKPLDVQAVCHSCNVKLGTNAPTISIKRGRPKASGRVTWIRLNPELLNAIEPQAKERGISIGSRVIQILKEHFTKEHAQ